MRYWLYSEGNILGPYSPAELLSVPAFSQSCLVCPETATGDNPGDWRSADQVQEIADAMSVGVGGVVSSAGGSLSDTYELETGLSSNISSRFDTKSDQPYGYEGLLNTIDNILGAYKDAETPETKPGAPEPDSSLMDRFDIRLSKIQEELEAARWEKNLLLERLRSKDREEQKSRERIQELEEKLRSVSEKTVQQDKEISQVRHLSELQDKSDTVKKLEGIKQESLEDQLKTAESRLEDEKRLRGVRLEPPQEAAPAAQQGAAAAPEARGETKAGAGQESRFAAEPQEKPETAGAQQQEGQQETIRVPESRPLKSMRPSHAVGLERTLDADASGDKDEKSLTSRKLTSLGHSQLQSFKPGDFAEGQEQAGAPKENLQPLPQQSSGIVYDFTVVTKAAQESEKQQFNIRSRDGQTPAGAAPAPAPAASQPMTPASQVSPDMRTVTSGEQAAQPQSGRTAFQQTVPSGAAFLQTQPSWMGGTPSVPGVKAAKPPETGAKPAEGAAAAPKAAPLPDKTERIPVPLQKKGDEVKQPQPELKKKRGKMAFIVTMIVFGSIAAGGLGYLFFGEDGLLGNKKAKDTAATGAGLNDEKGVLPETPAGEPAPTAAPETPAGPKPSPEPSSNENTRKAMETVKNYKLSGGRGTVSSWFANSFLSNSARGLNEEWSATVLNGDIFVVQYRLLKPKQDPLIYQFEVDVAKGIIVRGINNNAIELLDFSSKGASAAEKAPKPRPATKRKPKTYAQLPLPDDPGRQPAQDEPSGFETPDPDENEKVKYIRAQESDEELF